MITNQIKKELILAEKPQESDEEREEEVQSCITSVLGRPAFKRLSVKSNEPRTKGASDEQGEKSEIEQAAEEKGVDHEWSAYIEHEWNGNDEHNTPLSVSSLSGSEWTETVGDSETMELYNTTCTGTIDLAAKVVQKYTEDPEQFLFMCSVIQRNNEQLISEADHLLPPRNPDDSRKTLVLDLDETLVHCFMDCEEDTTYDWTFKVDSEHGLFDVFCRVRPHLEEFLKECAKMFELVLFTASQENYANKVLGLVDPAGYIQHRLFRRHCTKVRGNFVKDLSLIGRSLRQTIIIDNSPLAFSFQPFNGIPSDNWFDDKMDKELLQLLPLLRHLKAAEDVRDELAKIFQFGRFLSELRSYSIAVAEECDWMCVETQTC